MANQDKILWSLTDPDSSSQISEEQGIESTGTGFGPAPQLSPAGRVESAKSVAVGDSSSPPPESKFKIQTVNVKDDFAWTYTSLSNPQQNLARQDVPVMILREERILQNPTINALAYNAFAGMDHLKNIVGADKLKNATNGAAQWMNDKAEDLMDTFGVSDEGKKQAGDFFNSVKKAVTEITSNDPLGKAHKQFGTKDYRQHLEPYQRLYSTIPTGFKYKFPYFDDTYKDITTSFDGGAGDQSQLPFQKLVATGTSLIGSVVNTFNALKPGTYIEAPKYPSFPTSAYSYTASFPLLNTVSFEQTFRNWQLLFMLVYQNLPNRVNRSVILPPKLYECRIPGVWYSRYSHISRISINMRGSRREMQFESEGLGLLEGGGLMKVLVPDAWEVSIDVQELIPESQNYMFESIMRDGLVTVDQRDQASASASASTAAGAVGSLLQTGLPSP